MPLHGQATCQDANVSARGAVSEGSRPDTDKSDVKIEHRQEVILSTQIGSTLEPLQDTHSDFISCGIDDIFYSYLMAGLCRQHAVS